ncbi:MAG: hypothetical protein OXT65_01910 [Alphaproteobacteria bacterium]|nr:hypothetical protein [Alphaproteobacteria bacterium]
MAKPQSYKELDLPPNNVTVYSAYTLYDRNRQHTDADGDDIGAFTAAVLHAHDIDDTNILSAALLAEMPPVTHGLIKRQFGVETLDHIVECRACAEVEFDTIDEAPPAVQAIAMARATVLLAHSVTQMEDDPAFQPDLTVSAHISDMLDKLDGNTPLTALWETLNNGLGDYSGMAAERLGDNIDKRIDRLREEVGGALEDLQRLLGGPSSTETFEDNPDLLDDPMVRAAFDLLYGSGDNGLEAVTIASSLSLAGCDAVTVSTALLDIAYPVKLAEDIENIRENISDDVADILSTYSVYNNYTADQLIAAPLPFQCIVVAQDEVWMEDAQAEAIFAFDSKDAASIPEYSKRDTLDKLRILATTNADKINAVINANPDIPEMLAEDFQETARECADLYEEFSRSLEDTKVTRKPKPGGPKKGPKPPSP